MLKKLTLQDFKLFNDQEFNFQSGTTAIVGPNGSGKTTILEAIEFALFKRVTRKEKTIKRLDELIRHSAKKSVVNLEFEAPINRRRYRIERKVYTGKSTADLYQIGKDEPIESGPQSVDKHIIDLLGLDRHAFSALTYVRQGEIDLLSRLSTSKRRSQLYNMMGLGVYDDLESKVSKDIRSIRKDLKSIEETKTRLNTIMGYLPSEDEISQSLEIISKLKEEQENLESVEEVLIRIKDSLMAVRKELDSPDLTDEPDDLSKKVGIAKELKRVIDAIPDVAESQLRPHIRSEARQIFRSIFGDKYSDLSIAEDYEIFLYNLQGKQVPLMAASGGEDVCVNFSLRVAVNTALQKHSITGPPPGLIILDEPGAGLDAQRRRWLPDAIAGLQVVEQVIVVTHMEELKESTDHVISLIPQGKGRQPLVEVRD